MTAEEFRAALTELGMTQGAVADLMGAGERTARRWASGGQEIPQSVALALCLMRAKRVTPERARILLEEMQGQGSTATP